MRFSFEWCSLISETTEKYSSISAYYNDNVAPYLASLSQQSTDLLTRVKVCSNQMTLGDGRGELKHVTDGDMNHHQQCLYVVFNKIVNCAVFKNVGIRAADKNIIYAATDRAA